MISRNTIWASACLEVFLLAGGAPARAAPEAASAQLRALAAKAKSRSGWVPLVRHAQAAKISEERGLAYFVLGYRQLDAASYDSAMKNFRKAAETKFSLADYAAYYLARTAHQANDSGAVLEALEGFHTHFPESPLRGDALELYARTLLDTNQAQPAMEALTADSRVRQSPPLELLLARAYRQLGKSEEAARTYQEIYYAFPSSDEAKGAEGALDSLRVELAANFPEVSEAIKTARADKLYDRRDFRRALADYGALLRDNSVSSLAPRWKVGRARSLYKLRQISEALDALQQPIRNNPNADAERLSALTDIYLRQDDPEAMEVILNQLRTLYSESSAYASALDSAGDYFVRRGDWARAARYYEPLAVKFPNSREGREADWRLAWSYYLAKDADKARAAFANHLERYPDSGHAPAALYWLAGLAEGDGAAPAARKLYQSLIQRFGKSYYATRAERRLASLFASDAVENPAKSASWLQVADLAKRVPALEPPPVRPCSVAPPGGELERFHTLESVSLYDLAGNFLHSAVSEPPDRPELRLALSRFEMRQGELGASLLDAVRLVGNYSEYEFDALPREVWDLLYPRPYWNLVRREASARGIDPYLVMGLIRQESAFNPRAVSSADARGLMQILPQTAAPSRYRRRAVARQLMSPGYNVRFGTKLLRQLSDAFDGNVEQALAAYHAGLSRVNSWRSQYSFSDPAEFLETIPIPSTRVYVERVIRDSGVYRKLLTGAAEFADCRLPRRPTGGAEPAKTKGKNPGTGRAIARDKASTAQEPPTQYFDWDKGGKERERYGISGAP